jgi:hypothetical protein
MSICPQQGWTNSPDWVPKGIYIMKYYMKKHGQIQLKPMIMCIDLPIVEFMLRCLLTPALRVYFIADIF